MFGMPFYYEIQKFVKAFSFFFFTRDYFRVTYTNRFYKSLGNSTGHIFMGLSQVHLLIETLSHMSVYKIFVVYLQDPLGQWWITSYPSSKTNVSGKQLLQNNL